MLSLTETQSFFPLILLYKLASQQSFDFSKFSFIQHLSDDLYSKKDEKKPKYNCRQRDILEKKSLWYQWDN